MKLSNKSRYGVRAMFDIAFHNDGKPTQVRTIAERQAIPPRFLEQIFQDLKRAGLVTSKRGPRGGYALSRDPDAIHIGDVIRALEGEIRLTGDEAAGGDAMSRAITDGVLTELASRIDQVLDELSLRDLCERGESEGVRRRPPRRYVYSI